MPGSTAVVIGTGGLGHVAIQLLRALTSARVIALDVSEDKLRLARQVGAHDTVLSDAHAAQAVRDLTGGIGAEAVFDFVGADPTVRTAGAVAAVEGEVAIVGIGGGSLPVGFGHLPFEVSVNSPTGAAAANSPRCWHWPAPARCRSTPRRSRSTRPRSRTSGCTRGRSTGAR